jgi:hypothetical protein
MAGDARLDRGVTTGPTAPERNSTRTAVLAFAADVVCIVVFVAIGRRNHAGGVTLVGVVQTAWPFLAGLAAAWLMFRAWRAPTAVRPTGIAVWLSTVAIGMGLRAGTGAGIALSFIAVATAFTGALLLGWRAAVTALGRRRQEAARPAGG